MANPKIKQKVYRCQCRNTTNNLICRHRSTTIYNYHGKKYCLFHYKIHKDIYAIKIQKYYRGYRHRKLIQNIYNRLPTDLQQKISYLVRQDYYYTRYKITIKNLVEKHIDDYLDMDELKIHILYQSMSIYDLIHNKDKIMHCFHLYKKYNNIIDNTLKNNMLYRGNRMLILLKSFLFQSYEYYPDLVDPYDDSSNLVESVIYILYYFIDSCINPNTRLSSES